MIHSGISINHTNSLGEKKTCLMAQEMVRFFEDVSKNSYFDSRLQFEITNEALSSKSDPNLIQNGEYGLETRAMIIAWIFKACDDLALKVDTSYLAINYLSRLLSVQRVKKVLLLELAQACLFLAAKFNESDPPCARSILQCAGSGPSFIPRLLRYEVLILRKLEWKLDVVTIYHYLVYFCKNFKITDESKAELLNMALFFSQQFIVRCDYLRFKTIEVAVALLFFSKQILFCEELEDIEEWDFVYNSHIESIAWAHANDCVILLWEQFSYEIPEALRNKKRRTQNHLSSSPTDIRYHNYEN